VLLPELAELGAHLVEGAVPVVGAELQLLPSADETHECHTEKTNTKMTRSKKKSGNLAGQHRRTWKTCHAGPLWIRSASFSARLSEAPWPRNSSHSCYSS
jgi:hypothetical protein